MSDTDADSRSARAAMADAYAEACRELERSCPPPSDVPRLEKMMAFRIMIAIKEGLRDPHQLKVLALHSIGLVGVSRKNGNGGSEHA